MKSPEEFRAAAHQWFADRRTVDEAVDMAVEAFVFGTSSYPLPSEADRQRVHEWIARRHGLSVEEVAALGGLLGGKEQPDE